MELIDTLKFTDTLVARLPAFPLYNSLETINVNAIIKDTSFLEAIYLASPSLHQQILKYNNGQFFEEKEKNKLLYTIIKYYSRMSARCTPYGLFSGCAIVNWGSVDAIVKGKPLRHTRLDMYYLSALAMQLAKLPEIKKRLTYFINNSSYSISNEIRFIEYTYENKLRKHQISAIENTEYLNAIIEKAGAGLTYTEIIENIKEIADAEQEEVVEYVEELIDAQILVSELEPAITGPEFLVQLIDVLKKINNPKSDAVENIINAIVQLQDDLENMDQQSDNSIYQKIKDTVTSLEVEFEESKLFQTDLFFETSSTASISKDWQQQIKEAILLLQKLFATYENENLRNFAKRFEEKYGNKEIPLLVALDAETGVGYIENTAKISTPLIDGIPQNGNYSNNLSITWNKTQSLLLQKLITATKNGEKTILFTQDDCKDWKVDATNFPPSFSVMFRLVENDKILMESIGGSSAANLLGRFAHGSEAINELVNTITDEEEGNNENVVFAEIAHLPEGRVGNILLRPVFRKNEIAYLAKYAVDTDNQIYPKDLCIAIRNGKIQLRCKKRNKIIIPRLSSAHNYSNNALPVYQFLCEMQYLEVSGGINFYYGSWTNDFSFLPRVNFGNIIFEQAQWNLKEDDIKAIVKNENNTIAALQELQNLQVPNQFIIADGDNELLITTTDELSLRTFIAAVKGRTQVKLKEFLQPTAVITSNGNVYANQFIAPIINTKKVYEHFDVKEEIADVKLQPNEKWIYYKLYCGKSDCERVLVNLHNQIISNSSIKHLISKWFFIRYSDPQFHIRFRILPNSEKDKYTILPIIEAEIKNIEQDGWLSKVQIEGYEQELDRYHSAYIDIAESIFHIDAELTNSFLQQSNGDINDDERLYFTLQKIDFLLNGFKLTDAEKLELCTQMAKSFGEEHGFNNKSAAAINKKYLMHKEKLRTIFRTMSGEIFLNEYAVKINQIAKTMKNNLAFPKLVNLLGSYIHMSVNRMYSYAPRLHEAVIYDFLAKYYKSQQFINSK